MNIKRHTPLRVHRQVHDGWTDFFIGAATAEGNCHSVLDASVRVGVHYCCSELPTIQKMTCPSQEIPAYLWQHLQQQDRAGHVRRFQRRRFRG